MHSLTIIEGANCEEGLGEIYYFCKQDGHLQQLAMMDNPHKQ